MQVCLSVTQQTTHALQARKAATFLTAGFDSNGSGQFALSHTLAQLAYAASAALALQPNLGPARGLKYVLLEALAPDCRSCDLNVDPETWASNTIVGRSTAHTGLQLQTADRHDAMHVDSAVYL